MKVFVTGATGYIGSAMVEKLIAAGHSVTGLARSQFSAEKLKALGVEPQMGDLKDPESLSSAAKAADSIIQLALDMSDFSALGEAVSIEQAAISHLIEAIADTGKTLIYTSGTGVLDDTGDVVFDELMLVTPIPTPYAIRIKTEEMVLQASNRGLRTVVLRPPIVYGRSGGMILPTLVQAARRAGVSRFIRGTGDCKRSFVHVDDLADLYRLALEKAAGGELFYTAAESSIRWCDLAAAIADAVGLGGHTEEVTVEQMVDAIGPMAKYLASNNQTSGAKAREVLGWQPTHTALLDELRIGGWRSE
ncbi:NAD-dependent epimerase/dehydratase family protein [Leptolyngbya sp. FACHB-261]|uniref:NAD-dependent epimerase/dehydratase family protein n=1 Tax=Leptolyngbya sp. FACHB-261 TaxID=2692806 RepID=UPI0016888044|nr:NAD-dependent epimerase/dehydratase family protein [Leptolyngbya sp. FACHB-261]MBD2100026.1 NAD-dependent epimerase/dehydratase family protein [Leptolyngbya sp. FACHB-261]